MRRDIVLEANHVQKKRRERSVAVDVFGFLSFVCTLTTGMTAAPAHMWFMLLWSVTVRIRKKRRDSKSKLIESQWCNWFEVAKAASALIGAAALNLFQVYGVYNDLSHRILAILLCINIAEAVLSDALRSYHGIPNAVAGLVLLYITPLSPPPEDIERLNVVAGASKLALFPLSKSYILLYTTWNASFSYGGDWSWSTRLMLLAPIFTSIVYHTTWVWLCARCLSLMLNMILRASETTRFYQPGVTIITQTPRTFSHNSTVCTIWGCLNLLLAMMVGWNS